MGNTGCFSLPGIEIFWKYQQLSVFCENDNVIEEPAEVQLKQIYEKNVYNEKRWWMINLIQ